MKKVILLRHAKSSWEDADTPDHDRPLNERGRRAAPVIGAWLAKRGHRPDLVLASTATRSRETCRRLREGLTDMPEPVLEDGLYHATPEAMLGRLQRVDDAAETVMIVGHNPGLAALIRKLSGGRAQGGRARALEHFPTAAAAVLEFDADHWSELDYDAGQLSDFATPRELMER